MGQELTDVAIRKAKPREKAYKLQDTKWLYIVINPNGSKLWRMGYRFSGIEKTLSFGDYPLITLEKARELRDAARLQLKQGIDPAITRKAEKAANSCTDSFKAIATEWHGTHMSNKSEAHATKVMRCLENDVFPWIGNDDINNIKARDVLQVARRIESRGCNNLSHTVKRIIGQVFRYAIATGRAEYNPVPDLAGALKTGTVKNHSAITDPKEIGALLRAFDGYTGHFPTVCALKLSALVMLRPGEVRKAEWAEINFEAAEWRIPAHKMKMRDEHIIPLSRQAIAILQSIQPLTGNGKYVFPSVRSADRPMSENTVNAALRRLGYTGDVMTAHGFRAMASTRLNEAHLFHPDAIERQLAHGERDSVRAAYHRAQYLPERTKMMQWWADYLDSLRDGAKVIPFERKAG